MVRGWLGGAAALLVSIGVASAAPVTWESLGGTIDLDGGGNTRWTVVNSFGTSDGTIDGTCNTTGGGLAVANAVFDVGGANKGDTFDAGLTVWIDGAIFTSPPTIDVTGTTLTAGPTTMSGLDVTVQHAALSTVPALRTLITLRNPSTVRIETNLRILSNLASDGDTVLLEPDLEDASVVVTSDDAMTPTGAPIVSAFGGWFGPHGFAFTNAGFDGEQEVFPCTGTEGLHLADNMGVPPGETVHILLFTQLAGTNAQALDAAVDTYGGALADALLAGLDEPTLQRVLNFNFLGEIELVGGGTGSGTRWYVGNQTLPDNGAPTGGNCAAGIALSIGDAVLDPDGENDRDPFDYGMMLFVGEQAFGASLHPTVTSSSFADGPFPTGGLDTSVSYTAFADAPTLRTFATFTNPGATTVDAVVTMVTNVGSDSNTTVRASSSGDLALDGADRWVVTSDNGMPEIGDAVVTHVLGGPGAIPVPPALVSSEAFDCAGTEGVRVEFPITVPPGETRALMFFNDLHATVEEATASAPGYDVFPPTALLGGIDDTRLVEIVNWPFCVNDAARCDDGDACTVDACGATGGCSRSALPASADFLSVGCRLSDLVTRVGALPAGKVRDGLAAKVAAAQTASTAASGLVGQQKPYKKQLRRAGKALKAFEKRLKAKATKKAIAQATRDELNAISGTLRGHLKTLAAAV